MLFDVFAIDCITETAVQGESDATNGFAREGPSFGMLFRRDAAMFRDFLNRVFDEVAREMAQFASAESPQDISALLLVRFRCSGRAFSSHPFCHPLFKKFIQSFG